MATNDGLSPWDIVILVVYFAIVMAVGLVATFRANRGSTQGFFLAGKSMTWIPIAGSIFATNIGAPSFVGLAGSAAANGFAPIMFEWHATYMLILLGWIFVPIYIASASFTMPEYLTKRFGGKRLRVVYALIQLLLSILTGISGELYAGSLFIKRILGWDIYLSTVLILAITAIYTIGGGLAAVIYTDTLQAGILIVGALIVTGMSMVRVGGYEAMVERFRYSASNNTYLTESLYGNLSCGFPPAAAFNIFQDVDSPYPWPGLTFGLTLLAMYFWCTNQTIVQRNLAAKNMSHSKAAVVLASYLKLLPFFLFVWPGMISRILFPDEIACSDPTTCRAVCENPNGCTNIAYPLLVLRILPTGLRGLMLAALLAALMSSLTSQFNSTSSIFTMDIWTYFRPQAREREVVFVGRIFGLVMIALSIGWLPILQAIQGSQMWDYLQAMSSYITPPWVVIFLLGMFWKRTTEQGAFWGVAAGLVAGICRMGIHFAYPTPTCGGGEPETRPLVFTKVHYLHFALILAGVTLIVSVLVSLITAPRNSKQLRRVTWWTRKAQEDPELTDDEDEETTEMKRLEDAKAYIPREQLSRAKNIYNDACGFNNPPPPKMTKEEMAEVRRKLTDIEEDPFWSKICDINGVIAVAFTCFIIGFYA